MAILTKKTMLWGVAVIAGLLLLVKFMWKPLVTSAPSEGKMTAPTDTQAMEPKQMAPVATPPENTASVTNTAVTVDTATVKTSYKNPGGTDEIAFTLGVDASGIITEAQTEVLAVNPTSKMRQQAFATALPTVLVGKDIKTLGHIDRVGGSSLTTGAFNASLDQFKAEL